MMIYTCTWAAIKGRSDHSEPTSCSRHLSLVCTFLKDHSAIPMERGHAILLQMAPPPPPSPPNETQCMWWCKGYWSQTGKLMESDEPLHVHFLF